MRLTPIKEGAGNIGLTRVAVRLRSFTSPDVYQSEFLVDTGATDSLAPTSELTRIGIEPIGKMTYELASGSIVDYQFGLAEISFMKETTAGRVIFGPEDIEPILGCDRARVSGSNNRSGESHTQTITSDPIEINRKSGLHC